MEGRAPGDGRDGRVGGGQRRPLRNGDYLYGKRRLREIDRRVRRLSKSLDSASSSTTPARPRPVYFGATVTFRRRRRRARSDHRRRRRARRRQRAHLLALTAGDGAAQGPGRRHRDAAHAAWPRVARNRRDPLRFAGVTRASPSRRSERVDRAPESSTGTSCTSSPTRMRPAVATAAFSASRPSKRRTIDLSTSGFWPGPGRRSS